MNQAVLMLAASQLVIETTCKTTKILVTKYGKVKYVCSVVFFVPRGKRRKFVKIRAPNDNPLQKGILIIITSNCSHEAIN